MTDVIERELRAAMNERSEFLEVPAGSAHRAWAVARQQVDTGSAPPPRRPTWWSSRSRFEPPRRRTLALGGVGLAIVLVAAIIALGGNGPNRTQNPGIHGSLNSQAKNSGVNKPPNYGKIAGSTPLRPTSSSETSAAAGPTAPGAGSGKSGRPTTASVSGSTVDVQAARGRVPLNRSAGGTDGAAATRIVKTGNLSMTVAKGAVGKTITSLTSLTIQLGGYVSQSQTDTEDGAPSGSLTLRIPVRDFETAISRATALGHETALSTNASDVTGRYVDLGARETALKHTRATYLTILGRARTIGQTLSVQQRVNDIQEQIDSLEGNLKVLRNQTSDGTLTVDVSQVGSPHSSITKPHHRSGFAKSWHTSTHRFNRGVQAIIGALGPLLLALILLGIVVGAGSIALRVGRQGKTANSGSHEV